MLPIRQITWMQTACLIGLCVMISHPVFASSPANSFSDIAQGGQLWANNCARCHNLRSPEEFAPKQWQLIIQHMRIQAGLTGQEASKIKAFLMTQSAAALEQPTQNTPTRAAISRAQSATITKPNDPPLSGKAVYDQTCIACHGADGKGVDPGAPDFTSKDSPLKNSNAVLLQRIEHGYHSKNSPMAMPPRGGNPSLTNTDLKNALDYIRRTFGR